MKKILCLWAVVGCFLFCGLCVRADVIWEPEDSFYKKHSEECVYVNRLYTANGPDGEVILYKSPEMPIAVLTWENGFRACIQYTYQDADGIVWGIFDDYGGNIGWMPMEYMELVYDSISFREEHAAEIRKEQGSLDKEYIGESVLLWKYPGSEEYVTMQLESEPAYQHVYVDGNGNSWCHVGYYYGHRDKWICLDDPTADYAQLYPDGFPGAAYGMAGTESGVKGRADGTVVEQGVNGTINVGTETDGTAAAEAQSRGANRIKPKVNPAMAATAAALVFIVAAVTVILLVKLKKKTDK